MLLIEHQNRVAFFVAYDLSSFIKIKIASLVVALKFLQYHYCE